MILEELKSWSLKQQNETANFKKNEVPNSTNTELETERNWINTAENKKTDLEERFKVNLVNPDK